MKRQKIELTPSLKAEDFSPDTVVIATGYIKSVNAVKTKFDDDSTTSTLITVTDDAEKDKARADKGVFANMTSLNNCIDAFGEEDSAWIGRAVRVVCNKANYLNKKQLVVEAIKK